MRPGRELDVQIAREIFGHEVIVKNRELYETAQLGDRPLRKYSKEMEWAWEVAKISRVSLIPIVGGQWFAFAAGNEGWNSPQELNEVLSSGNFANCGASVGENAAEAICNAALVAAQKKKLQASDPNEAQTEATPENSEVPTMLM